MVMRRNGDLAADYARRHGVPGWTDDADALIHDPEVDADLHCHAARFPCRLHAQVAAAGKPVYVEKPMARSYAECLRMIDVCERAGVPLFVAYYRRAMPNFIKVEELVDSGAVGDVRFVSIQLFQPIRPAERNPETLPWRVIPDIAGGGHFFDLASHQLDFLDYLFGPITAAQGQARNQAGLYPPRTLSAPTSALQMGSMGSGVWSFTVRLPKNAWRPSRSSAAKARSPSPPSAPILCGSKTRTACRNGRSPTPSMCSSR
jgi:predicted dehydrogenase